MFGWFSSLDCGEHKMNQNEKWEETTLTPIDAYIHEELLLELDCENPKECLSRFYRTFQSGLKIQE